MNEITINGFVYQEREQPAKRKMTKLMFMAQMFGGFNDNTYYRQLPPNTDIVKEYGLIQLKQSNLSRWEREAVVNIFERKYKKV